VAVNDSSEIRTVGISISTREAGGGFAITGIFGPAVPLGSTIGTDGRFWKSGAGRGRSAQQADRLPLIPCPSCCRARRFRRGGLGSLARSTDASQSHARCSVISGQLTGNAEKVLGSQQPGGLLASNDPVPSTLPRNSAGSSTPCQRRPGH
jgi:hypothetical protein